ncbi:MAG: hypothetical protein HFJ19_02645 [Clostridia bacterium]|nr:hypothetical protein [Clostridia bacterium]
MTKTSDNATEKGFLHFYANLADDSENVIITSRLIDGEEKKFETIRKEDFLYHYQVIN